MTDKPSPTTDLVARIEGKILIVRGHKVMLDEDLAALYGVEVRSLNQAVRRNATRFPEDFMFQLTMEEYRILRSQVVILRLHGKHRKHPPLAFTEQGVAGGGILNRQSAIGNRPPPPTPHGVGCSCVTHCVVQQER